MSKFRSISVLIATALALLALLTAAPYADAWVTFTGPPQIVARDYQWEASARMPLGHETVQLIPNESFCVVVPTTGCSQPGEMYVSTRQAFYYELGHQFDWAYLTDPDRQWLADMWGVPGAQWADSTAALWAGTEDGLEGVFPVWFSDCAQGDHTRHQAIGIGSVPETRSGAFDICSYLRWLQAHA